MTDTRTIRLVVLFLGVATLLGISAIASLAFTDHPVPESLTTLTGTTAGALGALLASTRSTPTP
ncbi:MAG: hypothetical protein IPM45_18115 [Acidimicrobiales bacterium]|nr:hypothetical protein [Acidimicrobiales bacterium]